MPLLAAALIEREHDDPRLRRLTRPAAESAACRSAIRSGATRDLLLFIGLALPSMMCWRLPGQARVRVLSSRVSEPRFRAAARASSWVTLILFVLLWLLFRTAATTGRSGARSAGCLAGVSARGMVLAGVGLAFAVALARRALLQTPDIDSPMKELSRDR